MKQLSSLKKVVPQWLTLKILQRGGGAWLCYPLATKAVRLHSALIKWFCFFNRVAMDDNFLQDKAAPPLPHTSHTANQPVRSTSNSKAHQPDGPFGGAPATQFTSHV